MAESMRVAIATDHRGVDLKSAMIEGFAHVQWMDLGPNSSDAVDYPDFADKVCRSVIAKDSDLGILICGTGIGMSIRANRFNGVRAALCRTTEHAKLTREHNNANVLVLPGNEVNAEQAIEILHTFVNTAFEGGRHEPRVNKLDQPT